MCIYVIVNFYIVIEMLYFFMVDRKNRELRAMEEYKFIKFYFDDFVVVVFFGEILNVKF